MRLQERFPVRKNYKIKYLNFNKFHIEECFVILPNNQNIGTPNEENIAPNMNTTETNLNNNYEYRY